MFRHPWASRTWSAWTRSQMGFQIILTELAPYCKIQKTQQPNVDVDAQVYYFSDFPSRKCKIHVRFWFQTYQRTCHPKPSSIGRRSIQYIVARLWQYFARSYSNRDKYGDLDMYRYIGYQKQKLLTYRVPLSLGLSCGLACLILTGLAKMASSDVAPLKQLQFIYSWSIS